jgi:hypothetical protein
MLATAMHCLVKVVQVILGTKKQTNHDSGGPPFGVPPDKRAFPQPQYTTVVLTKGPASHSDHHIDTQAPRLADAAGKTCASHATDDGMEPLLRTPSSSEKL